MEEDLKTGGRKGLVTPSTALLNQRLATFSKPRMLTEYEKKLLRQRKVEISEAIIDFQKNNFAALSIGDGREKAYPLPAALRN